MIHIKKNFASISLAIIVLISLETSDLFCQVPESFNYQAVLLDDVGKARKDKSVIIKIVLRKDSEAGEEVYYELHDTKTDAFGVVNLKIGSENPSVFSAIDWSAGAYFVEMFVDDQRMGASQLLSVPYALHAKSSDVTEGVTVYGTEAPFENWDKDVTDDFTGDYYDLINKPTDFNDADADPTNEIQELKIIGNEISISKSNSINLPAVAPDNSVTSASIMDGAIQSEDLTNKSVGPSKIDSTKWTSSEMIMQKKTITDSWTAIGPKVEVTKDSDDTRLEIFVNTTAYSGKSNVPIVVLHFQVRVDGYEVGDYYTQAALFYGSTYGNISMISVHNGTREKKNGLSSGPHTIQIYAKTYAGTSTGVYLGQFNTGGRILVKEAF